MEPGSEGGWVVKILGVIFRTGPFWIGDLADRLTRTASRCDRPQLVRERAQAGRARRDFRITP
jgi:hypothetical protein